MKKTNKYILAGGIIIGSIGLFFFGKKLYSIIIKPSEETLAGEREIRLKQALQSYGINNPDNIIKQAKKKLTPLEMERFITVINKIVYLKSNINQLDTEELNILGNEFTSIINKIK